MSRGSLLLVLSLPLVFVFVAGFIALTVQPFVTPRVSSPPRVDLARLEQHVKRLSIDFHPRSHEQRHNLERAAQYIRAEFDRAGAAVSMQEVRVGEGVYHNVVARFGHAAGPLLVIGAHYDSDKQMHTPGADDNASGVAGLLELARLLGRAPPPRAVELVAYALEEMPHFATGEMGSVRHARELAQSKREVELMLSLEMIGYFADTRGSQSYPLPGMTLLYPDRGDYIALVGRFSDFGLMRRVKATIAGATELPVHSINASPLLVEGIDFSDHRSYWNEGFPALMVTDTAFYRYPHYHAAGDTYEKLDYARMAAVVQGVYAVAQAR
jgi:Zn-dependent M28 family amino/carboxypeptidase